jgi:beta-glucosidase/6-phospho-beta-glucosidase/beta-galactosidase
MSDYVRTRNREQSESGVAGIRRMVHVCGPVPTLPARVLPMPFRRADDPSAPSAISPLPAHAFMFCTGLESSYPTIRTPDGRIKRVDEYEKTGHYMRWQEDFHLVRELGIPFLRYGPPYHLAHVGPGHYDWSFSDITMDELRRLGITPIADLCHFGVPDWVGDFQNPDWAPHFAEFAGAFARRYPWVRFYTPINEIFICATFSALNGWWNECLASDFAWVTAIKNLCRANVLAMRAISNAIPEAVFIQSESSEYFHPEHPGCIDRARGLNERRYVALDLTYGLPVSLATYRYLLANGMTEAEYEWFRTNGVPANCVMGTDYYVTNEHYVTPDGSIVPSGEIFGYYVLTRQYYDRYRLPVMHTETNFKEPDAVSWLLKQWANIVRLKQDGVPVVGFTWYSLTDQVDWDTSLREDAGRVNPLGLVDLDRRIRPVGRAYQQLIRDWTAMMSTNSAMIRWGY